MQLDMELEPSSKRGTSPPLTSPAAPPPAGVRLERRVDGKLWLLRGANAVAVEVVRCFPWSEPNRYLSLRDSDGNEHAFITELDELDAASRKALGPGLARAGFVLDIIRIESVEEDFELRSFVVETLQGPRRFQTALDAWPRRLESGGLVLEDVYGDLYRVAQPHRLDQHSLELMRPFID